MFPPEEMSADLPAPHEEEPKSLRADILDELADHLQMATQRELLRSGDTSFVALDEKSGDLGDSRVKEIRRRVLYQFGNPGRIARQLWFDAMQEKLMKQKLNLSLLLLTLVCGGLFYLNWQSIRDNRDIAERQRAENAALLKELVGLKSSLAAIPSQTAPQSPAQPAEWNRLIVQCFYDDAKTEPAPGVSVKVHGLSDNTKAIPAMSEETEADGAIDFGLVLYGLYYVQLETSEHLVLGNRVSVYPGKDRVLSLTVPRPDQVGRVTLKREDSPDSEMPASLRERMWYFIDVNQVYDDNSSSRWESNGLTDYRVVIRPDGKYYREAKVAPTQMEQARNSSQEVEGSRSIDWGGLDPKTSSIQFTPFSDAAAAGSIQRDKNAPIGRYADIRVTISEEAEWTDELWLPIGNYRFTLSGTAVTNPSDESGLSCLFGVTIPTDTLNTENIRELTGKKDKKFAVQYIDGLAPASITLSIDRLSWLDYHYAEQIPLGMTLTFIPIQLDAPLPADWKQSLFPNNAADLYCKRDSENILIDQGAKILGKHATIQRPDGGFSGAGDTYPFPRRLVSDEVIIGVILPDDRRNLLQRVLREGRLRVAQSDFTSQSQPNETEMQKLTEEIDDSPYIAVPSVTSSLYNGHARMLHPIKGE
ncbi:MAG: hypothetical protein R3C01_03220 [Planctomycetaceae bacterium]